MEQEWGRFAMASAPSLAVSPIWGFWMKLSELPYTQMARPFLGWPVQLVWRRSDWDRRTFRWRTAADEVPRARNSANCTGATAGLK
jgi:hypothetical protein